jgi:hypothetical protein
LYAVEDELQRGTRKAKRIHDTIKPLIRHAKIKPDIVSNDHFDLPDNYAMYVRSDSFISKNYKSPKALSKPVVTPNALIK